MGCIVYFDIAAVCVMSTILITYVIGKRLYDTQKKFLIIMILSNMTSAIMDIVSSIIAKTNMITLKGLMILTDYVFFVAHIILAFSFAAYCLCLVGQYKKNKGWKRVMLAVPGAVVCATLLLQLYTNVIFTVDNNLVYHRMGGLWIICIGSLFYELTGIVYVLRYRKKASVETRIACYLFVIACGAFLMIQYYYPSLMIESFGISICILLFYLAMEKPEELTEPELGVLNQRAMLKMVSSKFQSGERFPCIILKVHNLKVMRQMMGTGTVMHLLKQIICYMEAALGDSIVFHFSQSMFVIALDKKITDLEAERLIDKISNRFRLPWDDGTMDTRFYIHITYLQCPKDAPNINVFMNYVQYMRGSSGENQNEYIKPCDMNIDKQNRVMRIRKMISDAVENQGFEVFYQPIFSVEDGKIISAEALIRMKDQSIGYISPEEFIPIAEQSGAILKIGEFVFESVCQFLSEENPNKYGIRFIEINLSVVQCLQNNLVESLLAIMNKYDIKPNQINLEITETAALHFTDTLEKNIRRLNDYGIQFSLDDYGSGYSNTDYLFRFPFNMVKIDKVILWEACKNERAMIALKNTIQMIKELGLSVVVEGVETIENVQYLTEQNCDFLQGYYYSKPVPKQRFLELLAQT